MTRSFAIAAAATLGFSLAVSAAQAGPRGGGEGDGCPVWACGGNGTSFNGFQHQGVSFNGLSLQGVALNGVALNGTRAEGLRRPAVTAVTLPSGETVDLR